MPLKHLPQREQPYKHIIEEHAERVLEQLPLTQSSYDAGVRDALLWVLGYGNAPGGSEGEVPKPSTPIPIPTGENATTGAAGAGSPEVGSILPGDIVRLKGKPDQVMTVDRTAKKGRLICAWHDEQDTPREGSFTPSDLEMVSGAALQPTPQV